MNGHGRNVCVCVCVRERMGEQSQPREYAISRENTDRVVFRLESKRGESKQKY